MRHSTQAGFTLMELLIAITVAGILLGIAIPSFNNLMVSNRLTTQANDIIAAINYARSEAIRRNGNVSFCRAASEAATTCETTAAAWQHWMVLTAGGTVMRRGVVNTYGGKMVVRATAFTDDRIVFSSDGLARTGGASVNNRDIDVCAKNISQNNFRRINIGTVSRISTTSPSGTCS